MEAWLKDTAKKGGYLLRESVRLAEQAEAAEAAKELQQKQQQAGTTKRAKQQQQAGTTKPAKQQQQAGTTKPARKQELQEKPAKRARKQEQQEEAAEAGEQSKKSKQSRKSRDVFLTVHEMEEAYRDLGSEKVVLLEQYAGDEVHAPPGWLHFVCNHQASVKLAYDAIVLENMPAYVQARLQVLSHLHNNAPDYMFINECIAAGPVHL